MQPPDSPPPAIAKRTIADPPQQPFKFPGRPNGHLVRSSPNKSPFAPELDANKVLLICARRPPSSVVAQKHTLQPLSLYTFQVACGEGTHPPAQRSSVAAPIPTIIDIFHSSEHPRCRIPQTPDRAKPSPRTERAPSRDQRGSRRVRHERSQQTTRGRCHRLPKRSASSEDPRHEVRLPQPNLVLRCRRLRTQPSL